MHKKKYFINFIYDYFKPLHGFSLSENYHIHTFLIAKKAGYTEFVSIVKNGAENFISDPNFIVLKKDFDIDIKIYKYKNIFNFLIILIWLGLKSIFNRKNIFYTNGHNIWSYMVIILGKIFSLGGVKNIFMAHTQPKRGGLGNAKFKQSFQDYFLFKFFVDKIRLNNISEKKYLLDKNINKKKLFISPLVVDSRVFKKYNNTENRTDVLFFGQIAKVKDVSTILKAFKVVLDKIPNTRLGIIGLEKDFILKDSPNYIEVKKNIDLFGFMKQDSKLNNLMNKYLVYINSSKIEGQCLAVFEAALAGCALCLPNIMSFVDVFKDKALFHDVGDYNQLAKNIEYYLNNPEAVKIDNEKAINMIQEKYNKDVVEEKMQKLFTF